MTLQDVPVVQFQLEHDDSKKNIIASDYRHGSFAAPEYLIELGHKRICFVTQEYKRVKSRFERYQGYVDALREHSIPVDERLVQYRRRDTGFDVTPTSMLGSGAAPTAFFTQHLPITTDLLHAMDEVGIRIPGDVSIIGFDDIPMAGFFRVPITVVKQQPYTVGTEAARLLIELIKDPGQEPRRTLIPCTVLERDSCSNRSAA